MRLGIFGGTFDPIHYGHLLLAESCHEQCPLDNVWFLPADVPPHKTRHALTPAAQRAEMIELAIGGNPALALCRHEIDRGGVNYTVDTLENLRSEDPSRELFFLMGADSLIDLPTWKDPVRLCQLAKIIVVRRAGVDPPDLKPLAKILPSDQIAAIHDHLVEMPQIGLSASDIRGRVARGLSIRYRTPRAVEMYIESHRLYRS